MTERQRLEAMRERLMNTEGDHYERMKKENALDMLIAATDKVSGKIGFPFVVPIYEHNIDFLKGILEGLGYDPTYEADYNYFYSTTCYTVSV